MGGLLIISMMSPFCGPRNKDCSIRYNCKHEQWNSQMHESCRYENASKAAWGPCQSPLWVTDVGYHWEFGRGQKEHFWLCWMPSGPWSQPSLASVVQGWHTWAVSHALSQGAYPWLSEQPSTTHRAPTSWRKNLSPVTSQWQPLLCNSFIHFQCINSFVPTQEAEIAFGQEKAQNLGVEGHGHVRKQLESGGRASGDYRQTGTDPPLLNS
jgi:hypothetical protein